MYLLKQDKDYNCGVYALYLFLKLNGYRIYVPGSEKNLNISELEDILQPDRKTGLSPQTIINKCRDVLSIDLFFKTDSSLDAMGSLTPCLVNYTLDEEGHWGVCLNAGSRRVILYDPFDGGLHSYSRDEFDAIWYSEVNFNHSLIHSKQ